MAWRIQTSSSAVPLSVRLQRIAPAFQPDKWHRTRSDVSWNNGFRLQVLVGRCRCHPRVWSAIQAMQMDAATRPWPFIIPDVTISTIALQNKLTFATRSLLIKFLPVSGRQMSNPQFQAQTKSQVKMIDLWTNGVQRVMWPIADGGISTAISMD